MHDAQSNELQCTYNQGCLYALLQLVHNSISIQIQLTRYSLGLLEYNIAEDKGEERLGSEKEGGGGQKEKL